MPFWCPIPNHTNSLEVLWQFMRDVPANRLGIVIFLCSFDSQHIPSPVIELYNVIKYIIGEYWENGKNGQASEAH